MFLSNKTRTPRLLFHLCEVVSYLENGKTDRGRPCQISYVEALIPNVTTSHRNRAFKEVIKVK